MVAYLARLPLPYTNEANDEQRTCDVGHVTVVAFGLVAQQFLQPSIHPGRHIVLYGS